MAITKLHTDDYYALRERLLYEEKQRLMGMTTIASSTWVGSTDGIKGDGSDIFYPADEQTKLKIRATNLPVNSELELTKPARRKQLLLLE